MGRGIHGIPDVAARHLCTGCGACAYLQPEAIRMVDVLDQGRRPLVDERADTSEALAACPGTGLEHTFDPGRPDWIAELVRDWGPVLEMWEGWAADDEVRFLGSSGGAATALSLFALEHEGFHGVLHVAAREDVPWLNRTVLSTTRAELVARTGSRYAPASPCDGLQRVADAPGPCVFVGKPCDVAGASRAAALRPELAERLGLTIAIFCAGAPSTRGTLELARELGCADPADIRSVRYRGKGWPGEAEVEDDAGHVGRASYERSWGKILQKHRQWRCYVCADHTGEFADVAVGDPWYREIAPGDPGRSLVVARTERGRRFVRAALEAGALVLEPAAPELLPASQPNLLVTRGAVWGRSLACRMLGVAAPRYRGLATGSAWLRHLSFRQRAQSIYGTLKRVFTKKLYRRARIEVYEPEAPRREPGAPRRGRRGAA